MIAAAQFSALISNFEDHNGEFDNVRPKFVLTKADAVNATGAWFGVFGARKYVSDDDRQELFRLADIQAPTAAIKGKCQLNRS